MKSLKSLISIRQKASPDTGESSNQGENSASQLTINDSGYEDSKRSNGGSLLLKECLENVYQGFKERCRKDEYYQRKIKEPYVKEQEQQKTELLRKNTAIEIKEEEISRLTERINKIDNDRTDVKSNPEKYGIDADKKPKAQFYMGLLVLLPITIYLLVFYISASYSAFFKDFQTSLITDKIFDGQALTSAAKDGWLEAVFVITIPFSFMGLGYLVHMFQKSGKSGKIKIFGLYVVTFIFDAILAFLIENKIYNFNKTLDSPDFNLPIAFSSADFWGIIFAGFVVYIIWGLVFDFVMEEFENIDKINTYIRKLNEEKRNLLKTISVIEDQINLLKNDIALITGKIKELQSTIDSFVFSNREYQLYHSSYLRGWLLAISSELHIPREEKDNLILSCSTVSREFLDSHGIGESADDTKILNIAI